MVQNIIKACLILQKMNIYINLYIKKIIRFIKTLRGRASVMPKFSAIIQLSVNKATYYVFQLLKKIIKPTTGVLCLIATTVYHEINI